MRVVGVGHTGGLSRRLLRRRISTFSSASVFLVGAACARFDGDGPADADVPAADASPDGGLGDASPDDVGTVDAAPTCPGNVLPNPGFDEPIVGWSSGEGEVRRVPEGRYGGMALSLCKTVAEPDYQLSSTPPELAGLPAGTLLSFEVWVRGAGGTAHPLEATLTERDPGETDIVRGTRGETQLEATWSPLVTQLELTRSDSTVKLRLVATGAAEGACFLIDDVCVTRVR
jgi:hypothetical protein